MLKNVQRKTLDFSNCRLYNQSLKYYYKRAGWCRKIQVQPVSRIKMFSEWRKDVKRI